MRRFAARILQHPRQLSHLRHEPEFNRAGGYGHQAGWWVVYPVEDGVTGAADDAPNHGAGGYSKNSVSCCAT